MSAEDLQLDDLPPAVPAPVRASLRASHRGAARRGGSLAGIRPECACTPNREEGRGCGGSGLVPTDISFDPAILDGEGYPNNLPSQKTAPGGEDWLTVNFHVNFPSFDALADRLDRAQVAAAQGLQGDDELQFGDVRFLVAGRGARQGRGEKTIHMRWRLVAENGLVLLLLNMATAS